MTNLEKLDNTLKELEEQTNELKEFNSVCKEITHLKEKISENLRILDENNHCLSDISNELESKLTKVEARLDEIYKENKSFHKELDSSIITRLEKHKSDVQVEIRNEGTQIQRAFENSLNTNFNSMQAKINDFFEQQIKKINTLKFLFFIQIIISIGLFIGFYFTK